MVDGAVRPTYHRPPSVVSVYASNVYSRGIPFFSLTGMRKHHTIDNKRNNLISSQPARGFPLRESPKCLPFLPIAHTLLALRMMGLREWFILSPPWRFLNAPCPSLKGKETSPLSFCFVCCTLLPSHSFTLADDVTGLYNISKADKHRSVFTLTFFFTFRQQNSGRVFRRNFNYEWNIYTRHKLLMLPYFLVIDCIDQWLSINAFTFQSIIWWAN